MTELSNWAELNSDLLRAIYKELDDPFDYINFRAVCKSWKAAVLLCEHPPQFPFLLERDPLIGSDFDVYSLHTGKTRRLHVLEARNKKFFGQSQGYLVTFQVPSGEQNSCFPALLNPFTQTKVHLPFDSFNFYRPVYVGIDPIRNTSNVVIVMRGPSTGRPYVGFWRSENNDWALKGSLPGYVETYHKGRLFCSEYENSCTKAIDLTTGNTILEASFPTKRGFCSLVEGAGALFGIAQFGVNVPGTPLEKCEFEVYRLDENAKPPCWVKRSDIGDLMIFLNYNICHSDGFCLSASDFDGFSGNCIYFTKSNGMVGHYSQMLIGRYDLGKNRSEVIDKRSCSNTTWILPNFY
ncbi:hypothetical protein LUZ61_016962 [Rhynchospora tenuis]|uniref:KIB1-4 beta-propeller domain-containing protein n=1 Tax=Rhynchospora tenuis TaxID=198213 RepID=A0AAD6EKL5_9POAL|nr:hypothetical protein LUZ61_016962 [Rhynchospora tenuis]